MAATLCEYRASNLGELIQAKTTLEAIIKAIPNAVIVLDPNRRVVTANPLGHQILETPHPEMRPADESADAPVKLHPVWNVT
jgi:nitrogen fixation/metabolism regulation signal transduction histidine kinase